MTSSRLGAEPVTAQKTFWVAPVGRRLSHHGATSVAICGVGMEVLNSPMNGPVKLTLPLLATKTVLKLPPPKRIGNGGVILAAPSSLRFRPVPVMAR